MGEMATAAVAALVKTPGLSPIKTRLGKTIGRKAAEAFYSISCRCIENSMVQSGLDCFWAIAERQAADHWGGGSHSVIAQGHGDLGDRLNRVYSELIERFDRVVLVGGDFPLLTSEMIKEAFEMLDRVDFFVRPAFDGGYTLFAGKKELPKSVWTSVPYSTEHTLKVFEELIKKNGDRIVKGDTDRDIDTVQDLLWLKTVGLASVQLPELDQFFIENDILSNA